MRTFLILAIVLILFSFQVFENKPDKKNELLKTEWKLTSFPLKPELQLDTLSLTISFAKNSAANGFAGCNLWSAKYKVHHSKLSFLNISTTRRFCTATMPLENAFLDILRSCETFKIHKESLTFYQKEKSIATFTKVSK